MLASLIHRLINQSAVILMPINDALSINTSVMLIITIDLRSHWFQKHSVLRPTDCRRQI